MSWNQNSWKQCFSLTCIPIISFTGITCDHIHCQYVGRSKLWWNWVLVQLGKNGLCHCFLMYWQHSIVDQNSHYLDIHRRGMSCFWRSDWVIVQSISSTPSSYISSLQGWDIWLQKLVRSRCFHTTRCEWHHQFACLYCIQHAGHGNCWHYGMFCTSFCKVDH